MWGRNDARFSLLPSPFFFISDYDTDSALATYDAAVITCLFLLIHLFVYYSSPPLSPSLHDYYYFSKINQHLNSFLLLFFTIGGSVLIIALLLLIFRRRHILPPPNQLHVHTKLTNQLFDRISSKLIDPDSDNARYLRFFSYLKITFE